MGKTNSEVLEIHRRVKCVHHLDCDEQGDTLSRPTTTEIVRAGINKACSQLVKHCQGSAGL